MLKIKDNVDLKELENFGFEFKDMWIQRYVYENQDIKICIYTGGLHSESDSFKTLYDWNKKRKEHWHTDNDKEEWYTLEERYIYVRTDNTENDETMIPDVVLDLIEAGLVEKTENNTAERMFVDLGLEYSTRRHYCDE